MTDENEDKTADEIEREYGLLTTKQKAAVDVMVETDKPRTDTDMAHDAGVSGSYLNYVRENFGHIIEYREKAMRYATDGSGEEFVDVRLTEDEAFRAIRVLPAELSQVVYQAVKTER